MNFSNLLKSIFDYDPDGPNIHHLMAVHEYSVLIAQMENVDEHTLLITELAAYLHDGRILQTRFYSRNEEEYFLN